MENASLASGADACCDSAYGYAIRGVAVRPRFPSSALAKLVPPTLDFDTIIGIRRLATRKEDQMDDKAVVWMGSSKKDLLAMPEEVIKTFGHALGFAQNGLAYPDAKTLTQFKPVAIEILEDHDSDTYRAVYTAKYDDIVYVLHCFKKKSTNGANLPKQDKETIEKRLKAVVALENAKRKTA